MPYRYICRHSLPTSSLGGFRVFDRTTDESETSSSAESELQSPKQRRDEPGSRRPVRPRRRKSESSPTGRGRPSAPPSSSSRPFSLAVSPSPSPLEATPQTAPKTATTDDASSAVFLRTLEPLHSRIVKTDQS